MFRRGLAKSLIPAAMLLGLMLGGPAPAQAQGRVVAGVATSSSSCPGHPTTFEGVNVTGNTWSFTFVSVIGTDGGCSFADAGHVTGVWNPTSTTTQYCVTGTAVGRFCLALPTTTGVAGTDTSVPFSACLVTCVAGSASVTVVDA